MAILKDMFYTACTSIGLLVRPVPRPMQAADSFEAPCLKRFEQMLSRQGTGILFDNRTGHHKLGNIEYWTEPLSGDSLNLWQSIVRDDTVLPRLHRMRSTLVDLAYVQGTKGIAGLSYARGDKSQLRAALSQACDSVLTLQPV
jgi:hypothetical protein